MPLFRRRITPRLSYIICSGLRTGSTLLCEALRRTGIAGRPAEYFNPNEPTASYRREYLGATMDKKYLRKVVAMSTTPNGVFGTKVHFEQLPVLVSKIDAEGGRPSAPVARILEARFPNLHYLWLRRKNDVRQAISLYRAVKTRVWWEFPGGYPPMYRQAEEPGGDGAFNFDEIVRHLSFVRENTARWEEFFARNGITPLEITYEALDANYEETVSRVLYFLGLPVSTPIPPRNTKRQADILTDEWEKEFLRLARLARLQGEEFE